MKLKLQKSKRASMVTKLALKRRRAKEQGTPHLAGTCAAPQPWLRTVSTSPATGDIRSYFVPTPKAVDGSGEVVPPDDWHKNKRYAALWDLDFSGPEVDPDEYNAMVSEVTDLAWLVAGIRHCKLAVLGSTVLELVNLTWKPCWVPLHMVEIDSPKLEEQLKQEKTRYKKLGPKGKFNRRKTIPQHVNRVMAIWRLTKETTFLLRQINQYAIVPVPDLGENIEVIKADFRDTYEHSSALFMNKKLWADLLVRRVEAANCFNKENKSSLVEEFKARAQQGLTEDLS